MLSLDPKELPIPKLHQLLLGAIGPRPIAFASTIDENGNHNLSPFSFFNVFSANPPILIFSPARSGRTNETKDTYKNVKKVPEVVINIITYDIVQQMSLSSSPYAPEVDEFVKAGFTSLESELVRPRRVAESPVQFECKVNQVIELGAEGGAGNLIICEVVKMHINENVLDANGLIDQHKINLVARMGGNWYSRAAKGLFSIPKPLTTLGIGVDQLPTSIKNSSILTGNDLGILGNSERIPSQEEISEFKKREDVKSFLSALEGDLENLTTAVHIAAHKLLSENKIDDAWLLLMCIEKS
jgi:flavin reductase (DIM6/NTAB) family NADH-FMN oxidoreductase RutF